MSVLQRRIDSIHKIKNLKIQNKIKEPLGSGSFHSNTMNVDGIGRTVKCVAMFFKSVLTVWAWLAPTSLYRTK